jgi:hypothetical protein
MWIVMTSSAKMPNSCWGRYRNIAIVEVGYYDYNRGSRPAMISTRARNVLRVRNLGHHNVGKTERCAYRRALADAERLAYQLNNTPTVEAGEDILMSWGGSA